jgi:hypothetical protein
MPIGTESNRGIVRKCAVKTRIAGVAQILFSSTGSGQGALWLLGEKRRHGAAPQIAGANFRRKFPADEYSSRLRRCRISF